MFGEIAKFFTDFLKDKKKKNGFRCGAPRPKLLAGLKSFQAVGIETFSALPDHFSSPEEERRIKEKNTTEGLYYYWCSCACVRIEGLRGKENRGGEVGEVGKL